MTDAQPNFHRRRLGLALRDLRESVPRQDGADRAGLTVTEAAERLGRHGPSAISKIERAQQRVTVSQLDAFFEAYQVDSDEKRTELRALASLASSSGRANVLREYRGRVSDPFAEYLHLEELALRADMHTAIVPGLLQTRDYAAALIERGRKWQTSREVENYVSLRIARQNVWQRSEEPLQLWCILDEAALRRRVGSSPLMKEQLQRLIDIPDEHRNVTIQVLPFDAGAHAGIDGAYHLLYFSVGAPVVVVEPMTTTLYLEDDSDIGRYETGFNHLRTEALSTDASRQFIIDTIKDSYT